VLHVQTFPFAIRDGAPQRSRRPSPLPETSGFAPVPIAAVIAPSTPSRFGVTLETFQSVVVRMYG
jgi:hypothetical protein